jgi:homospermidine synthase
MNGERTDQLNKTHNGTSGEKQTSGETIHAEFPGSLVILGYGSIAQGVLPLVLRHFAIAPDKITIIAPHKSNAAVERYGVKFQTASLTRENYLDILNATLRKGDFLLNLSVDVASLALIEYCWRHGILYLDTCTEPWPGRYDDPSTSWSKRSNYALREEVLAFRLDKRNGPTAVITQGANPGLASIFVKQALINIARDTHTNFVAPTCYEDWAKLAQQLDIKVIHIAERDTQYTARRKQRDEFINTWSVDGFLSEGLQPAELGWGTHERLLPADADRHGFGCDAAIYLRRPGAATRVRSWTPLEGAYQGFLITHSESISIADHLTLRADGEVIYRPTVHYAYYPCDDTVLSLHELTGKNWRRQARQRIIRDDIVDGRDELGVLLMGNQKGVYWYGSRLDIQQARELAPDNNATSLQVVAGVIGGLVWALRNPECGVVEPDDLDHELILEIAKPYLGELTGAYGEWTPLQNLDVGLDEHIVADDCWQFSNFRLT